MKPKSCNLRFWVWTAGGPVKLTLAPGEHCDHYTYERTDEGWRSVSECWTYCEQIGLVRDWKTAGQDCDGRVETSGADLCLEIGGNIDHEGRTHEGKPVAYPSWEEFRPTRVYDQYAQMANY